MRTDQLWKRFLHPLLAAAMAVPLLTVAAPALAAITGPAMPVNVDGTISSDTENIGFGGQMTISTRVIDDPVFSSPTIVELIIDFGNVVGVGKSSGKKFVTQAQTVVHRPLLAFDQIEVIFPYAPGSDVQLARAAKVFIAVSFNANSGFSMTSKISRVP